MRVLVIGATGTIGKPVADAAEKAGHEVLRASRHGDPKVDIDNEVSIKALYEGLDRLDAVICCAGSGAFKPLLELTNEDIQATINSKLLGQVNLVRHGVESMNDDGVFILTSGIFSQDPMPGVPALAMVNGGVESFTRAAALDLPRGIRIHTVCPPFMKETAEQMGIDGGIPATENAKAYVALLTEGMSGRVVRPK